MTKLKGAAKNVSAEQVSPNWKRLKEEAQDAAAARAATESSADVEMKCEGDDNDFVLHVSKKTKKRNRKRKSGEGGVGEDLGPTVKRAAVSSPSSEAASLPPIAFDSRNAGEVINTLEENTTCPTKVVALDCEYVGSGPNGQDDVLARVSIVNEHGETIYNKLVHFCSGRTIRFVKPREKITDYRTHVSGIRPANLTNGESFQKVQREVSQILADRIVVGHALNNDFRVLNMTHPRKLTRDTARYGRIREVAKCGSKPSLKLLAQKLLGIDIQQGEHDSIVDAKVALRIYQSVKKKWEADIRKFRK